MKDFYNGARNELCIWVNFGRVGKIAFIPEENIKKGDNKLVTLERGTADKQDFLYLLKIFLKDLSEWSPSEFMELYIGLTYDAESMKLADEIYRTCINKDQYPISVLKVLANEDNSADSIKKKVGVNAKFGDAWSFIRIEDGIVTLLAEGSSYAGRHVYRNDIDFYDVLSRKLEYLADKNPDEFMEFYHMVKDGDIVAFEIAEKVRKNKIAKTNAIFNV